MTLHGLRTPFAAQGAISVPPMFRGDLSGYQSVAYLLPEHEHDPDTAYEIVHNLSMLDGNARLNLATFVSTWMEEQAQKLYAEAYDKNLVDKDEYPRTALAEKICVHAIANLWHAPDAESTIGTSTVGSSEACMLAGLAFKRRWQEARRTAGKSTDNPNMVFSSAVQVVWERFCNFWDVEPRYVPVTLDEPMLTAEGMLPLVDENTIGVVGILGVTYTGGYEPIAELARALDDLQERTGVDVPLHVDAASGGMVAPFIQPDLIWDFQLTRVHSINTSGHKYGLVFPGLGWIVWRKSEYIPSSLIFHVSYLGGDMPTLGINFSRPGAQVLLQAYLFIRLGREGYRNVHQMSQEIATHLADAIGEMHPFELLTRGDDLPVFAWRMKPGYTENWNLQDLSDRMRETGWQVPAYPMPDDISDVWVMRVVVRAGMSPSLAQSFLDDLAQAVQYFDSLDGPIPRPKKEPARPKRATTQTEAASAAKAAAARCKSRHFTN